MYWLVFIVHFETTEKPKFIYLLQLVQLLYNYSISLWTCARRAHLHQHADTKRLLYRDCVEEITNQWWAQCTGWYSLCISSLLKSLDLIIFCNKWSSCYAIVASAFELECIVLLVSTIVIYMVLKVVPIKTSDDWPCHEDAWAFEWLKRWLSTLYIV